MIEISWVYVNIPANKTIVKVWLLVQLMEQLIHDVQ